MVKEKDLLTSAIHLACIIHMKQKDKAGKPYILHPLHVMYQFEDTEDKIIAVLHDVLEDSKTHPTQLAHILELPKDLLEDIEILTHKRHESYEDYIKRVGKKDRTRRIKMADLEHNMDTRRLKQSLSKKDEERLEKYKKAYSYLKGL